MYRSALGWVYYPTVPGGVTGAIALYSCYLSNGKDYFVSTQSTCEGFTQAEFLGYAVGAMGNTGWSIDPKFVQPVSIKDYESSATPTRVTNLVYASKINSGDWLIKPIQDTLQTSTGSKIQETKIYYDNQAHGTLGSYGRVNKVESGDSVTVLTSQTYGYDGMGNLLTVSDGLPTPNTTTATYSADGLFLIQVKSPPTPAVTAGIITKYFYYCINETTCTFDQPKGALKAIRDPNSDSAGSIQTVFKYDPFGRVLQIAKPGDLVNDATYRATQEFEYNDTGLTSVSAPLKIVARQFNHALIATDSPVSYRREYYDGLGRVVEAQTASTGTFMRVSYTLYDSLGRARAQSVPYELTNVSAWQNADLARPQTTSQYDALSRVVSVTGPDGVTGYHRYGVDDVARPGYAITGKVAHRMVDGNNHHKIEVTDALGRLIRMREFEGTCSVDDLTCLASASTTWRDTQYSYDEQNNLRFVTDASNNQTEMRYDALGRKNFMHDVDMGDWTYGYDQNSNLITQNNPRGIVLAFDYDSLNRLITKRNNVSGNWVTVATYGYDTGVNAKRQRSSMSVPNLETTTWTYANRGQVASQTRSINMSDPSSGTPVFSNFGTSYTYDNADRLATMTYPNGEIVTPGYDAASQLVSISGWQILSGVNAYASGATYSALGQLTKLTLASGLNTQYRYFGLNYNAGATASYGRLRGICVSTLATCADDGNDSGKPGFTNASSVRLNLAYAYDGANSNILKIGDRTQDQGQLFTYDAYDRLTRGCTTTSADTATCNATVTGGYDESYAYNAIGNLTSKGGVNLGYTDVAHKHAVTTWNGVTRYVYDQAGNMTSRLDGSTFAQEWNEDNRMTKVTVNGLVTRFFYDADGALIKKFGSDQKITVTVGSHYEWDNATNAGKTRSFYFFNGHPSAPLRTLPCASAMPLHPTTTPSPSTTPTTWAV